MSENNSESSEVNEKNLGGHDAMQLSIQVYHSRTTRNYGERDIYQLRTSCESNSTGHGKR